MLLLSAMLLATPFGALSIGTALLARKPESVIGAVNFVQLPLTCLSSVFMAQELMPAWTQASLVSTRSTGPLKQGEQR